MRPGDTGHDQVETLNLKQRSACFTTRHKGVLLGSHELVSPRQPAGQPVTVNVADATLALWRPLTWKVSFLPG
jgi:hypothetical protein